MKGRAGVGLVELTWGSSPKPRSSPTTTGCTWCSTAPRRVRGYIASRTPPARSPPPGVPPTRSGSRVDAEPVIAAAAARKHREATDRRRASDRADQRRVRAREVAAPRKHLDDAPVVGPPHARTEPGDRCGRTNRRTQGLGRAGRAARLYRGRFSVRGVKRGEVPRSPPYRHPSSNGGEPPKVLDCFAGGGAIPLEALRLGCETTAVDLNPVACLIEKCVLEYPQRFGQPGDRGENSLADDFVTWAQWVGQRAQTALARVFPTDAAGRRPAVYFWARTMICPNAACQAEIPLLRERWLANNARNIAWIEIEAQSGHVGLVVRTESPPPAMDPSAGTVRASSVACPGCGTTTSARDVRDYARRLGFGRRLYAVLEVDRGHRTYRPPTAAEIEAPEHAGTLLDDLEDLEDGTSPIPDEGMVKSQYRRFSNLVSASTRGRGCSATASSMF